MRMIFKRVAYRQMVMMKSENVRLTVALFISKHSSAVLWSAICMGTSAVRFTLFTSESRNITTAYTTMSKRIPGPPEPPTKFLLWDERAIARDFASVRGKAIYTTLYLYDSWSAFSVPLPENRTFPFLLLSHLLILFILALFFINLLKVIATTITIIIINCWYSYSQRPLFLSLFDPHILSVYSLFPPYLVSPGWNFAEFYSPDPF